ncbi:MAG TPA: hypothetical protein VNN07_09670, partial [Candidatus Tectomicrobia bacterium]|nr:hypothetical protein [Candidatus Tectomicrobia bacterium]
LEGFEVVCAVPLAVTPDRAGALAAFQGDLARYLALPFYRAMLERAGFAAEIREFDRGGTVPGALAEALGGLGDASVGGAYVKAYRDAGVTLPAVRPVLFPDAPWYAGTLEAAATW